MKNIQNKKINLYIGLKTNDFKDLDLKKTLNFISRIFIKNKITGFNVNKIQGYWNKNKETALIISFINVFGVDYKTLKNMIIEMRDILQQDSILLEILNIPYEFV